LIRAMVAEAGTESTKALARFIERSTHRTAQALAGEVETLRGFADTFGGFAEEGGASEELKAAALASDEGEECALHLSTQATEVGEELGGVRNEQLRSGAGSRGAQVGNEISDREIDFVSHGGDDGDGRSRNGAGHGFLVELPQILHASPTPCDEDDID